MCSAGRRGFNTFQSRKVTSASSAEYSVALSIGDARETDECAARTRDFAELDRLMAEEFFAQHIHAVIGAAGIEHIGQKQCVFDRRASRCHAA